MELRAPHSAAEKNRSSRIESWVAIFVALTSLTIALYEAHATREHDRMSVWPRLSQESSDSAGNCSLYGECWSVSSDKADPVPVRTCTDLVDTASIGP